MNQSPRLLEAQHALTEEVAHLAQALGSPFRLQLLSHLSHNDYNVEQLALRIGQSVAATSAHLKVLRQANLVLNERDGRHVIYRLAAPEVVPVWLNLRRLSEVLSPRCRELINEHFESDTDFVSDLDEAGLWQVLHQEQDSFQLVDLRSQSEYERAHLPGAKSFPSTLLEERRHQLESMNSVLLYGRGPYCPAAVGATQLLATWRLEVKRLRFSLPEWAAAGYPCHSLLPWKRH